MEESRMIKLIEELSLREEFYWKQRGKSHWLNLGDKNTSFFHAAATKRKKVNRINRLKGNDGSLIEEVTEIWGLIHQHFGDTFRTNHPEQDDLERGTEFVSNKVDEKMNNDMLQPYTEEEVQKAVFQMAPLKSPGPDGIPPIFYQFYWSYIKSDVLSFVLNLLNNRVIDSSINKIQIVLIPKGKNSENLGQFRPISLCNVLYKIVSKTIANKLKPILDHIISQNQFAFVPGRLITDNILISYEINHFLKTKYGGNKCHAAIKLDISKAYDKVKWSFLERMLVRLGFDTRFVELILSCVTSVSYSFLLNDDTQIYCEANHSSISCIKDLLEIYAKASGQEVNYNKSSMVLSRNSSDWIKLEGGLGFRSLKAFNLALLAKHMWRLLTKPQSLLSQVLKAEYFPFSSPLEASPGYRPSFTWRSILSSKEIILTGSRWQIGSGSCIRISSDPWIPRPSTFKPITPPPERLENAVVAAMINPVTHDWDRQIVDYLFEPDDMNTILQIPLGREGHQDSLCWHYTKSGLYSVRSGYHVASHTLHSQATSSAGLTISKDYWNCIWTATVPPKVHIFAWRLASEGLPTGCSLHWIHHISKNLSNEEFNKFLIVAWFIWWSRNKRCMENRVSSPLQTITAASSSHAAFSEANSTEPKQRGLNRATVSSWRKPPPCIVKINFDGAVFLKGSEVGIGAVARDSEGTILAWVSHRFQRFVDAEHAEALAAREAVDLAARNNWKEIIVEGDCLSLINKLNSHSRDLSHIGVLVSDIRLASFDCSFISFSHLKHTILKCLKLS
ncbi:UNVERIFIED_CONTAM: hypothetical protein Sradi_3958800 [Sesamum radiatum]|uniref:Reverse transcriptase domain-containing protein n=1 Tax=Sesamum radiatum TaxID=300843 RepID=A0AAW2PJQ0_SESRA